MYPSQSRLFLRQLLQWGFASSHLTCRFLQVMQPVLTLLVLVRGILGLADRSPIFVSMVFANGWRQDLNFGEIESKPPNLSPAWMWVIPYLRGSLLGFTVAGD